MGIFDDIKGHADANEASVEAGIDQAGDFVDGRTGGRFAEHVDKAQEFAKDWVGDTADGPVGHDAGVDPEFGEQWPGNNQPGTDPIDERRV